MNKDNFLMLVQTLIYNFLIIYFNNYNTTNKLKQILKNLMRK